MLSFLGFLFIIIIVFVLFIVLSVLSTILGTVRNIFSFNRKPPQQTGEQRQTKSYQYKKIFGKNAGEYVDFEEV